MERKHFKLKTKLDLTQTAREQQVMVERLAYGT
jgi:hypothetical protein